MSALATGILRWCCGRLDEQSRPWGDAMVAEIDYVSGSVGRLRWALGGVTVMVRMLLKQWLRAGTPSFAGGDALLGGGKPPRRRWTPVVFAVLTVALFFVPEFRQAVGVVSASVATFYPLYTSSSDRYSPVSEAQLERVAAKGRATRNAQLLSFAAINSADASHQRAWADEAITVDSNQTWIDYVVAMREAERSYYVNPPRPQRSADLADARRRAAVLERWDPDNAVPYLLEAQLAVKDPTIFNKAARKRNDSLLDTEPEWLDAMRKAFAAPRYDSYVTRRVGLSRAVPQAFGSAGPWATMLGVSSHPIPNLMQLRSYATYLVGNDARGWRTRGPASMSDPAVPPVDLPEGFGDPARMARYWQVALMGERMQLNGTDIEKLIGVALDFIAYRPLMIALQKTGQADQAAAVAYRIRQINRTALEYQNPARTSERGAFVWLAAIICLAVLVALLSGMALAVSAIYLGLRAFWRTPHPRFHRGATTLLYSAPAWLLGSCLTILVCYWPFAQAYGVFMTSRYPPDPASLFTMFGGFASLPSALLFSLTGRGGMMTWSVVTMLLTVLLLWRVARMFRPVVITK